MENNETFKMTYSAQQQAEVEAIRKKYIPREEDKMAQLRALDASVGKKATAVALILGIVGSLILGIGMCFAMTEIGDAFGLSQEMSMVVCIIVGLAGIVLVCLAFPVYRWVSERQRRKIAPQVLRLTEELMK